MARKVERGHGGNPNWARWDYQLKSKLRYKLKDTLKASARLFKRLFPKLASKTYTKCLNYHTPLIKHSRVLDELAPLRIVFFDIDGVVCTAKGFILGLSIDHTAVQLINRLLRKTGAKLVISSTWRKGVSLIDFHTHLQCMGFDTGSLYWDEKDWRTPSLDVRERGHEIKDWLDRHPEVESYVILDDDSDMLPEQMNNFVHTDAFEGFGVRDLFRATAVLLNKPTLTQEADIFIPVGCIDASESFVAWMERRRLHQE